jgi:THO complex subunit 2
MRLIARPPSYKQQKFNLLREESEGYAKLAAELLSNMGPPHSVLDAKSQEGEKGRMRRARLVGDSVKSLIGTSSPTSPL